MSYRKFLQVLLLLIVSNTYIALAQITPPVKIKGKVIDKEGTQALRHIVIVNKRTGTGTFAEPDGAFNITALQTDTLMFSANGFSVKKICFKDSLYKSEYTVLVKLQKLYFVLKEIDVFPVRRLEDVQKDIDKIGMVRKTDTYNNINAFASPITYLYERFSKLEQSKRWVAEKESEEVKRGVLKDLFRIYVKYDIINLSDKDFDEFINYCYFGLSDNFIKTSSEFELVMAIKEKYNKFSSIKSSAREQF